MVSTLLITNYLPVPMNRGSQPLDPQQLPYTLLPQKGSRRMLATT